MAISCLCDPKDIRHVWSCGGLFGCFSSSLPCFFLANTWPEPRVRVRCFFPGPGVLGPLWLCFKNRIDEAGEPSSSLGASKDPATDPIKDENNGDDDACKLEDGDLVSLLCHTCQSSSTALQAVREGGESIRLRSRISRVGDRDSQGSSGVRKSR